MYEAPIFPGPLQQSCSLETNPLCLNTRLHVKKNFKIHITFIEINVNLWLLCAHLVIKSIIIHTRRPNWQKKLHYALGFYFSNDYFYRIWGAKSTIFTSFHFPPTRYVLKIFRLFDVSNRIRKWNKFKNIIYVGSKFQLCQLEIPISYTN